MSTDEYIESLLEKIDKLTLDNKKIRRSNSNIKAEVRYYRRRLTKMEKEIALDSRPKCNKGRRFR